MFISCIYQPVDVCDRARVHLSIYLSVYLPFRPPSVPDLLLKRFSPLSFQVSCGGQLRAEKGLDRVSQVSSCGWEGGLLAAAQVCPCLYLLLVAAGVFVGFARSDGLSFTFVFCCFVFMGGSLF